MKIAAGILTHNQFRYERHEFFRRTVRSIVAEHPDELFIVSNGSDDGTAEYVTRLGGTVINDAISTCGHGMNVTIGICAAAEPDLIVFSNDDIEWKPRSFEQLKAFWSAAPDDIAIASGLLEDDFPWNTVRARVEFGGVVGLSRDSAPGGAWTLRPKMWHNGINPVPEAPGLDDVPICNLMTLRGYRVCQLDLAVHLGEDHSTWANGSAPFRKPLDRAAWGLPCPETDDAVTC